MEICSIENTSILEEQPKETQMKLIAETLIK